MRPRTLLHAVAVLLAVLAGAFFATRPDPATPLSASSAREAALADEGVRERLREDPHDRIRVLALDEERTRVSFLRGPQVVLDVAVDRHGAVTHRQAFRKGAARAGASSLNRPWVLAVMTLAFLLAAGVRPVRHLHNADVAALATLTLPILLLNQRMLTLAALSALPGLVWLIARCARVAWREPGRRPSRPLVTAIDDPRRARPLLAGAGLLAVVATVGSDGASDVASASVAGATELLHGRLPYGHISTEILHGDTYPILTYVVFLPGALIEPVHDMWSDATGALWVCAAALVAGAVALHRTFGAHAALAWLLFPPMVVGASAGVNDVVVAALLAIALAGARRAPVTAAAIAAAAWVKVLPVALLPMLLRRLDGARRGRAVAAVAAVSAVPVGVLVALGGADGVRDMAHALAFQLERRTLQTPWAVPALGPAGDALRALALAGLLLAVLVPPRLRDLRAIAAAGAALLLCQQLAAHYWTWSYALWVVPLVAAALLWPERLPRPAPARALERSAS